MTKIPTLNFPMLLQAQEPRCPARNERTVRLRPLQSNAPSDITMARTPRALATQQAVTSCKTFGRLDPPHATTICLS